MALLGRQPLSATLTTSFSSFSCRRVLAVGGSRGGLRGLRSDRGSPSASSIRTPPPSGHFGGGELKEGPPRRRVQGAAAAAPESSSRKVSTVFIFGVIVSARSD